MIRFDAKGVFSVAVLALSACSDGSTAPSSDLAEVDLAAMMGDGGTPIARGPECHFFARLDGRNEVPPRDTRARAVALLETEKNGTEIRFRAVTERLNNITAAHLHLAPVGTNGPVVVPIAGLNAVVAAGTIKAASLTGPLAGMPLSALVDAMRAGNVYMNFHTDDGAPPPNTGPGDFPGGEIRGQVRALDPNCGGS